MKTKDLVLIALFGALTSVFAFISIPIGVVPITLQTLGVYLSGVLLGRKGAISQVIYVLIGIIGLPVFAGGSSGIGAVTGPTGGFIIGFIVGAYVIGLIIDIFYKKVKSKMQIVVLIFAMVIGTLTIYSLGVLQLMNFYNMSLANGIKAGVTPFLFGDALKMGTAVLVGYTLRIQLRKLALI